MEVCQLCSPSNIGETLNFVVHKNIVARGVKGKGGVSNFPDNINNNDNIVNDTFLNK